MFHYQAWIKLMLCPVDKSLVSVRFRFSTLLIGFVVLGQLHANAQAPKLNPADDSNQRVGEEYFGGKSADSLADLLNESNIEQNATDTPDPPDSESSKDIVTNDDDDETSQDDEDAKAREARRRAMITHLQRLQKPIHEIRISHPQAVQDAPKNRAAAIIAGQPSRMITGTGAGPMIANRYPVRFCHQPLYFEEINLERCGNGAGCYQNAISGIGFLANTVVLPYRTATQPCECTVATLGDCQTCQTFSTNLEPLANQGRDRHGLFVQAAAIAGFTFLLL